MNDLSEIKKELLTNFIPDYEEVIDTLNSYSDYELSLIKDNCPEYIDDLSNTIIGEIQGTIIDTLFGSIINNWDKFISNNEDLLADYYNNAIFMEYDDAINAYYIFKDAVINECENLIKEGEGEYSINENIDFRDIIFNLNKQYPFKFCEA